MDALEVPANADLYALGFTSHASVNDARAGRRIDVEFPDEVLKKSTFCPAENIERVLEGLPKSSL